MFYKNGRSLYIGSNCGQNSKGNWMEFPFVVWPLYLGFILTLEERQRKKETKNCLWMEISCLITYLLDFVSVLPVCWVALDFSGGRVHHWSFFKVGSYNQPYAILGTKHWKKMGKIQVKYKHTHTRTRMYRLTKLILANICARLLVYAMVYPLVIIIILNDGDPLQGKVL